MEGTAARLLMLTSMKSVQRFCGANSSRGLHQAAAVQLVEPRDLLVGEATFGGGDVAPDATLEQQVGLVGERQREAQRSAHLLGVLQHALAQLEGRADAQQIRELPELDSCGHLGEDLLQAAPHQERVVGRGQGLGVGLARRRQDLWVERDLELHHVMPEAADAVERDAREQQRQGREGQPDGHQAGAAETPLRDVASRQAAIRLGGVPAAGRLRRRARISHTSPDSGGRC
jgi:hypothetical protein